MTRKRATTGWSYLRLLFGFALVVGILVFAKAFIVPLALAILLTFILAPIVRACQQVGLWRVPAVVATMLLAFAVIGTVGWGVGRQVNELAMQLPLHKEKIKKRIADLRGSGEGAIARLLQMIREIAEDPQQPEGVAQENTGNGKDKQVVVVRTEQPSSVEKLIYSVSPVLEPLATAGLVIILVLFMLVGREDLRNRLIGLLGHGHLTGTTRVFVDAAERVSNYLLTQMLVNVGFGTLFSIALLVIEVPYAFLWGFLTGVLRFVPYIGTWISVAFPLTLSFALAPDWTQPVTVLVIFAVMELVIANVIEPLVFGHSTGVTPIALLVAAAFWTWVWGPIGLVLSTPLTVCMVVLGQHVPRFKYFALLLGNQPPLKPHVSYFQRLLSKDAEEAKQIALAYGVAHGTENVFDDVLLRALLLVRLERKQEGVTDEDEEHIFEGTKEILTQLETESAKAPPNDGAASASASQVAKATSAPLLILGCAAHQKAEELSLRMLGALMMADGCRVEALSTDILPAEIEARVAEDKPVLVFIAVLPPGGLVQARYLCRRLRKRFANLPLVVGFWGESSNYGRLLGSLRSAGASYLTTTLLQSRSQIRALTHVQLPPAPVVAPQAVAAH